MATSTTTTTTNPFLKTLTFPTFHSKTFLKPSLFFHKPTIQISISINKPPHRHTFSPFIAFASDESTPNSSVIDQDTSINWNAEPTVDAAAAAAAGDDSQTESDTAGEGEGEEEGGFTEPPEEAKLFVGNLPYDVDSEKLANLFDAAGVVEIAEVIYNRETDRSRGFGFVTMSTVEEAEKAVEMFNSYDIGGRLLTVNKAAPRGSRPERPPPREFEPSFRIYVGNLPWDVNNDRLEQLFSEHGKVLTARVVSDRETGRSRGFGFVSMASEAEMNEAIAALDGQSLEGRSIRVNIAEERPPPRNY